MCGLTSVLGVASIGASLFGGLSNAQAAKDAAAGRAFQLQAEAGASQYQAQVARNNAIIARRNIQIASDAGQQQLFQRGIIAGEQQGKTRAAQGANGLVLDSGSNKDVISSERYLTELDKATIANNTAKAVYGAKVTANNFEAEATLDDYRAANSLTASGMAIQAGDDAATASLISGATSVADKWLSYSQKGVFGG